MVQMEEREVVGRIAILFPGSKAVILLFLVMLVTTTVIYDGFISMRKNQIHMYEKKYLILKNELDSQNLKEISGK